MKDFETFRKKLPAGTTLLVVKNTLVEKAIEGTKFEPLKAACKGPNAFIFSGEEVAPRYDNIIILHTIYFIFVGPLSGHLFCN